MLNLCNIYNSKSFCVWSTSHSAHLWLARETEREPVGNGPETRTAARHKKRSNWFCQGFAIICAPPKKRQRKVWNLNVATRQTKSPLRSFVGWCHQVKEGWKDASHFFRVFTAVTPSIIRAAMDSNARFVFLRRVFLTFFCYCSFRWYFDAPFFIYATLRFFCFCFLITTFFIFMQFAVFASFVNLVERIVKNPLEKVGQEAWRLHRGTFLKHF